MENLKIKTCVLGVVGTNCYLVFQEESKEAVIIDPADNALVIEEACAKLALIPKAIFLTHGHFDHVLAAQEISKTFGIDIYAGEYEKELLIEPAINMSLSYGCEVSIAPQHLVKDGELLSAAGFIWKVIGTPGHTKGSVCFWIEEEEVLFSGDTLFAGSLGRTDLPGGSNHEIIQSIADKLFVLPKATRVYPGHGEDTTIAYELIHNPVARFKGGY